MDNVDLIAKLDESLQYDIGDWGRTQYLIKRIQKNQNIFQSDKIYIERILKSMQLKIQELNLEFENSIQSNMQSNRIFDLIKCSHCDIGIELDQKAMRERNFWFHEKCFEKINYKKRIIQTQKTIQPQLEKSAEYHKPQKNIITTSSNLLQIIFTASLLILLIESVNFLFDVMFAILAGILGVSTFIILYYSNIIYIFSKKKYAKTGKSFISKTGIPGFESIISNGLKKNSTILISGPPGSGKTTFGLQFLFSGAKDFDEPGVYVTLSQNIDEIKNDCKSFGWDFDALISQDKILMIDARPFKIQDEVIGKDDSLYRGEQMPFEHLTKLLLSSIKRVDAKRVVIDSVTILAMQYSDKFYMRQGLQAMIQALENYGVTSLIISEYSENNEIPLEWFVTSGIIQMNNQITSNGTNHTIQIKKLRGVKHSEQIHYVEFNTNGLRIIQK